MAILDKRHNDLLNALDVLKNLVFKHADTDLDDVLDADDARTDLNDQMKKIKKLFDRLIKMKRNPSLSSMGRIIRLNKNEMS